MTEYYSILKKNYLFTSCDDLAITHIIECMDGQIRKFHKNELIYNSYDKIEYAGLVLCGKVHSIMTNTTDSELVMCHFEPGNLFAESYACIPSEPSDIQIIAHTDSTILFLKLSNLFLDKAMNCPYASKATANLLKISAHHNIFQARKVQILTQKHIRDRLLIYLNECISKNPSHHMPQSIQIPFNRQELANYLGVERSALSREMCRMKEDKLIDFDRNRITLYDSLNGYLYRP